jgi:PKD repeat protein
MMAAAALLLSLTLAADASAIPAADFSLSPATARVNEPVSFTGTASGTAGASITSVSWDFGDGGTAGATLSPQHSYGGAGIKTITFTATDSTGWSTSVRRTMSIVGAPTAAFSFSPNVPNVGAQVGFDATASTDPGGAIGSYAWDFGDGTSGSGAQPRHAYASGDDKIVTLTTTAGLDGRTTTVQHTVHVNVPPQAALVWAAAIDPLTGQDPLTPLVAQRVGFSAQGSSDPDGGTGGLRFAWDPGSGTFGAPGAQSSVSVAFPSAGPRTVRVRVTDSGGATAIATATFRVNSLPLPSFTFSPASPAPKAIVTFTSGTTDPDGDLMAQAWDLNGDGKFDDATGPTARAGYLRRGQYTVGLRATDRGGASATVFHTVSVLGPAASGPGATGGGDGGPMPTIIPSPGAAPVSSGAAPVASQKGRLKVVPGVRLQIAGTVRSGRTSITQLLVIGPRGALVVARCRGRGCPAKAVRGKIGTRGRLRLRGLERSLRAGTEIVVSVAKKGYVTRQLHLRLRADGAPRRTQTCLFPGGKAGPCPAS